MTDSSLAQSYGERAVRTLTDFREFAAQAARLVARGRTAFDEDEMLRLAGDAVIVKLGEAVARLPEAFVDAHVKLPLRAVKDMRNLVADDYDAIRPSLVWNTLERDLPPLDATIGQLLES